MISQGISYFFKRSCKMKATKMAFPFRERSTLNENKKKNLIKESMLKILFKLQRWSMNRLSTIPIARPITLPSNTRLFLLSDSQQCLDRLSHFSNNEDKI